MKSYLVLKNDVKHDVKIVRDGVNYLAAIFSFLWLVFHRQWQLLLLLILYWLILNGIGSFNIINHYILGIANFIPILYLWMYANEWRIKKYIKQGYYVSDIIMARNIDEAYYKTM